MTHTHAQDGGQKIVNENCEHLHYCAGLRGGGRVWHVCLCVRTRDCPRSHGEQRRAISPKAGRASRRSRCPTTATPICIATHGFVCELCGGASSSFNGTTRSRLLLTRSIFVSGT